MSDEFEKQHPGLIDDKDPALDYILYNEMEKEDKQTLGRCNGGCLSLVLLMLVPPVGLYLLLEYIS